jgi:hypothetical protein
VQGLGSTAATLVEAAKRIAFQVVVVERGTATVEERDGGGETEVGGDDEMNRRLAERVPFLSAASARKAAPKFESSRWAGRTVDVRRVLGRWFRFETGDWQRDIGLDS